MSALTTIKRELSERFELALSALVDERFHSYPPQLAEACRYALFSGGKRVRPLLTLLAASAIGEPASATPFAAALELVHTYSLIHDDLPAMDDDDLRRGRPTVHKQFDEALAILAGDALLTEAFGLLACASLTPQLKLELISLLAAAAGGAGMVGGQVLDIAEKLDSLPALEEMQRLKTGALLKAAAVGGGLSAGANAVELEALGQYGAAVGLLFQITDDLLDAAQDQARVSNSYLHHLPLDAVHALRDQVAQQALSALRPLGDRGELLHALVINLQHRTL